MKNSKRKALKLRREGKSLRDIKKALGVPKSTLSNWLKEVELTEEQKEKLKRNKERGAEKGRKKAALIHKKQKREKINKIKERVKEFTSEVKINQEIGETIFSTFYLAEGNKEEDSIRIANSDPEVLEGFVKLFRHLYDVDESKFRCCLHLRKDQEEQELKHFWSKRLDIPEGQFQKTQYDKRTAESTYEDYKGTCVLLYFDVDLQRRILYIADNLIEKMIDL